MLRTYRLWQSKWQAYKESLKEKNIWVYRAVDLTEMVGVAVVIALLVRALIIQHSVVPTGSMIPTLMIKDHLFVNKAIYYFKSPERGDIVVFRSPMKDGKDYVKRCVGLPGDVLEVRRGDIYINNQLLVFPGVQVRNDYSFYGPTTVPQGHFFMMGDNRGDSFDSRFWGFVPKKDILGKAWFNFWPLSRVHVLR